MLTNSRYKSQYRKFTRSKAGSVLYFSFLALAGAFTILPMIYAICTSFKPLDELLVFPPTFFVKRPTLQNYIALPSLLNKLKVPMSRYIFNSLFITVAGTSLHVLAASAAAFFFSKSRLRCRKLLFTVVQFSLLYNAYTLAVPQYLIFGKTGIIDTYLVYILPAIPSAMGCFLMKQFIEESVPNALMKQHVSTAQGWGVFIGRLLCQYQSLHG